jgi:hypothetical protein
MTFKYDKSYAKLLNNKSVAIVGPSPSIIGKRRGKLIDSCDIVVRMNRAIPVSSKLKKDIGSRTDILYNCLKEGDRNGGKIDIRLWEKNGIKFISSPYPMLDFSKDDIESFIRKNNGRLRFHKFPVKLYKLLEAELGTRPNTGFLAIIDLLFFNIKSLYVTGITFGIDGYYKEYLDISLKEYMKMANGKNHKQNPQFLYIKNKIFNIDNRFVPDNTLKYILKNRKRV